MAQGFVRLVVKELDRTVNEIRGAAQKVQKASQTALKVEGFRLMNLLKEDLRQGQAGAGAFDPLTEIARRLGKRKNRKPLSRLAVAVRYAAETRNQSFAVAIGFLEGGTRAKRVSKSWTRIARAVQEGFAAPITEEKRRAILDVGESLRKRKAREAKYFFLRKTTTVFKTPPRPIIEPFLAAHRNEIGPNVMAAFERKMKGERI